MGFFLEKETTMVENGFSFRKEKLQCKRKLK